MPEADSIATAAQSMRHCFEIIVPPTIPGCFAVPASRAGMLNEE
jgi:hypothetical protein